MIPRRIVRFLVYALAVLLVAVAVVMGGFGLTSAVGDQAAARVFGWIAAGIVALLVIDMLLLVGVLGLNYLAEADEDARAGDSLDN